MAPNTERIRDDSTRWALLPEQAERDTASPDLAGLLAEARAALGERDDDVHLGILFGSAGRDLRQAQERFAAAAAADPQCAEARAGLATVQRLGGDPDGAAAALDASMSSLGREPALLLERAWCAFDRWRLDEAADLLREGVRVADDPVPSLLALSFVSRHRSGTDAHALDEAQQALEEVERLGGEPPVGWHTEHAWLAHYRLPGQRRPEDRARLVEESRSHAEAALALQPFQTSALEALAAADPDSAIPLVDDALTSRASGIRSPGLLLVASHMRRGDALELLSAAVEADPYVVRHAVELASYLGTHVVPQEGLRRLETIPDDWPTWHTSRARLLLLVGRLAEALDAAFAGHGDPFGDDHVVVAIAASTLGLARVADDAAEQGAARWPGSRGHLEQWVLVPLLGRRPLTAVERLREARRCHADVLTDEAAPALCRSPLRRVLVRLTAPVRRPVEQQIADTQLPELVDWLEAMTGEPCDHILTGRVHRTAEREAELRATGPYGVRAVRYAYRAAGAVVTAAIALTLVATQMIDLVPAAVVSALVAGTWDPATRRWRGARRDRRLDHEEPESLALLHAAWMHQLLDDEQSWAYQGTRTQARHTLAQLAPLLREAVSRPLRPSPGPAWRSWLSALRKPFRAASRDEQRLRVHAQGVAAAVQDLQACVLTPAATTRDDLRRWAVVTAKALATGQLASLAHREPEPAVRRLRARLASAAGPVLLAALVPVAVALYGRTSLAGTAPVPTTLQELTALLPVAALLLAFDGGSGRTLDMAQKLQGKVGGSSRPPTGG